MCVTGSWSVESGRTEERLLYLHIILKNYVGICEAGYDVTVTLLLYSHGYDFERFIHTEKYMCERIGRSINIKFEYFQLRPLPNNMIAGWTTKGDLAIRHREVFLREKKNFDLFIVQEDDVSIDTTNLRLFSKSLCAFRQTRYFPGLYDSEIKNGTKYLSWRLRSGTFSKVDKRIIFQVSHVDWGGRAYIIPSYDLATLVLNATAWIDPSQVTGHDFNPTVASSSWMKNLKKIAIFIDSDEWRGGDIHHLSNKYIHKPISNENFNMPTEDEMAVVFNSCSKYSKDSYGISFVNITGDNCKACLDGDGTVRFTSSIEPGALRRMLVKFTCVWD